MLGYSLYSNFSDHENIDAIGVVRSLDGVESYFSNKKSVVEGIDVHDFDRLAGLIKSIKPDLVVNCIGIIKQLSESKNHIESISINSLLPHKLAVQCTENNAKLIHFSTDCVFNGLDGGYLESSEPNAKDLYGRSKFLGEVDYDDHLTLRTSIIGHELKSSKSLVDWFLSQSGQVKGFSKAVFSGVPTCYLARLIADVILENLHISGLYHLSAAPINKFDLITKIKSIYGKNIDIELSKELVIDRSLNSAKLKNELSIDVPSWDALINEMHLDYVQRYLK